MGEVRCHRYRSPGNSTRGRFPGRCVHTDRPALGNNHAITTKSSNRAHNGTEVSRICDSIQCHKHRSRIARFGFFCKLQRVGIGIGRNAQRNPLVDGIGTGEAVKLRTRNLQKRNPSLIGHRKGFANTIIHVDFGGDVKSGRRNLGPKCFDNRVSTGHHFRFHRNRSNSSFLRCRAGPKT